MNDILDGKVYFLTDSKGARTHAVLPISVYDELLGLRQLLDESKNLSRREDYFFSVKGVNASGFPLGKRTSPGFMLNKGSMVSIRHAPSLRKPVIDVKNDLIMRKILVINTKLNCYELKESYLLTSPSFAASLVAGNTRNGLDVWTNQEGFSLKDSGYGPKGGDGSSSEEAAEEAAKKEKSSS